MTIHCFANIITPFGTAANNRGENQGNATTLQKLLWQGRTHTTVSAEAIRFALRRQLELAQPKSCNRVYDEELRENTWRDAQLTRSTPLKVALKQVEDIEAKIKKAKGKDSEDTSEPETNEKQEKKVKKIAALQKSLTSAKEFLKQVQKAEEDGLGPWLDDDLLGYMRAESAKVEGESGLSVARRAVLELTRAVSLTPWAGDVMFNAASPGATPSAAKKGASNPVPYAVEIHATRYQYGFALTPARLKDPARAKAAITALCALGEVAGNHARFLYDFSPESVVFRLTHDPAPRLLYCFAEQDGTVSFPQLLARVQAGDIAATELVIGGTVVASLTEADRAILAGATLLPGVRAAAAAACAKLA
jgi:CRISPR-associated protein Cst2